ncbi:MAG: methyltransferase [Fluviicola sp.]|nr:methyltransferase [Fluviicola sp.]MBP6271568.1 methyltransferase [Fluviicola sp.]
MKPFQFKQFSVQQSNAALKVGTDAMILGALCFWENPQHLLDIGTGTGVLSLMAAQRFPFQTITAIDISEQAILDAQVNFQRATFPSAFAALQTSIQDFACKKQFDAIICNPPYFENSSKNEQEELVLARHTDALPFSILLKRINELLTTNGKTWLIFPADYLTSFEEKLANTDLFVTHEIQLFGKPGKLIRTIVALEKSKSNRQLNSLTIRNEDGSYSDAYKKLTLDFHDRVL